MVVMYTSHIYAIFCFFIPATFFHWKWQQFEVNCYRHTVIMWPTHCWRHTQMAGFSVWTLCCIHSIHSCAIHALCFGLMDGIPFIVMHCEVMYSILLCCRHHVWLLPFIPKNSSETFSERLHLPFECFQPFLYIISPIKLQNNCSLSLRRAQHNMQAYLKLLTRLELLNFNRINVIWVIFKS